MNMNREWCDRGGKNEHTRCVCDRIEENENEVVCDGGWTSYANCDNNTMENKYDALEIVYMNENELAII